MSHKTPKQIEAEKSKNAIVCRNRKASHEYEILDDIECGLMLHGIVPHPADPARMHVAISAAGTFATADGGASWERQDQGFPHEQAWWTVKRQAMASDRESTVGLYLGTTSGELWASDDEGQTFSCLFRHLPHIFSVTVAGSLA